ncbi:MAG: hypothetical protein K2W85_12345 [Phycisphaerales bacterium]|nr:hypothetical protein [Phycisphaerales bacterium]
MNIRVGLMTLGMVVAGVSPAALADGDDIQVTLVQGELRTGAVVGEPPNQNFGDLEQRVFGADLDFNAITNDVRIDEPGYASRDPLLLGQSFQFTIRKALRQWNGSAFVSTTTTMGTGLPDLGQPFINTPATDTPVAGYSWLLSDDFHFEWLLNGATAGTGQGIYLAELELTTGQLTSRPFWIAFNYGLTEAEHDAAIDWVQESLVPAPGTAGILGLMILAGGRRRRTSR